MQTQHEQWITFNVGGRIYASSYETLTQALPNGDQHLLSVMLRTKQNVLRDKDGNICIDRDGKLFRYMLDYLQNSCDKNTIVLPTDDLRSLRRILFEAEFYHLNTFVDYFTKPPKLQIDQSSSELEINGLMIKGKGIAKLLEPIAHNVTAQIKKRNSIQITASYFRTPNETWKNPIGVGLITRAEVQRCINKNIELSSSMLQCKQDIQLDSDAVQRYGSAHAVAAVYVDPLAQQLFIRRHSTGNHFGLGSYSIDLDPMDNWFFVIYSECKDVTMQIQHLDNEAIEQICRYS